MLGSLLRTAGPRTCISVAAPCIPQHSPAPEIERWTSWWLAHELYLWKLLHLVWQLRRLFLDCSSIAWRWCRRGGRWRVRRCLQTLGKVSWDALERHWQALPDPRSLAVADSFLKSFAAELATASTTWGAIAPSVSACAESKWKLLSRLR